MEKVWSKEDEKKMKEHFGLSMKDEVDKLSSEIEKEEKDKEQKSPQILENVPEEIKKGNKKILLG